MSIDPEAHMRGEMRARAGKPMGDLFRLSPIERASFRAGYNAHIDEAIAQAEQALRRADQGHTMIAQLSRDCLAIVTVLAKRKRDEVEKGLPGSSAEELREECRAIVQGAQCVIRLTALALPGETVEQVLDRIELGSGSGEQP